MVDSSSSLRLTSDRITAVPSSARRSGWYATAEKSEIMVTLSLTPSDNVVKVTVYENPDSR